MEVTLFVIGEDGRQHAIIDAAKQNISVIRGRNWREFGKRVYLAARHVEGKFPPENMPGDKLILS